MQRVACAMEGFIRDNLDQWYMYRPMWDRPGPTEQSAVAATTEGERIDSC
jgi:hypothetical protein